MYVYTWKRTYTSMPFFAANFGPYSESSYTLQLSKSLLGHWPTTAVIEEPNSMNIRYDLHKEPVKRIFHNFFDEPQ